MNSDAAPAFRAKSIQQIDHVRGKINHCLDQLRNEDVWWTPRAGSNPIGVILQHLIGNLRQWALSGIGGARDVRDRPSEFRIEQTTPKAELQAEFNALLNNVVSTYSSISVDDLLNPKKIQGFDTTVLDAIYDTVCHLALHTGQVLYLTRLRLGPAYRESWNPATTEQGA